MYYPKIGIEVHVELNTKSKMFCSCLNDPDEMDANAQVCPICLGHPGTLPVINKQAVKKVIKTGLALNCKIAKNAYFDRKNYFYPDLPKGYQISQHFAPFCKNGFLKIAGKKIRIREVHLEEDTCKLLHPKNKDFSLVDCNRSGIPLMELVTEPDLSSGQETKDFARELHLILRYLDVSEANMEKGQMRIEANVSISKHKNKLGTRTELKNINSFRAVEKAINFEIKRQEKILESNKKVVQETRGWDDTKQKTILQRKKETAFDYRYFPEPDLPAINIKSNDLKKIKAEIPELPQEKRKRFKKQYELSQDKINVLVKTQELSDYFEKVVKLGLDAQKTAKLIINKPGLSKLSPKKFIAKVKKQKSEKIENVSKLTEIVKKVIKNNPKPVQDYKKGKTEAFQYLIGQIMKQTKGRASVQIVQKILKKLL